MTPAPSAHGIAEELAAVEVLRGSGLRRALDAVLAAHAGTHDAAVAFVETTNEVSRTVLAVAGRSDLSAEDLASAGIDRALTLEDRADSPEDSIARAAELLEELGRELGGELGGAPAGGRAGPSSSPAG